MDGVVVIHSTDPLQEPSIELNSVPDTLEGYPVPKPSHNRKSDVLQFLNFKEVDDDAKKVVPGDFSTIEDLSRRLTTAYPKTLTKVRALLVWLSTQPILSQKWSTFAQAESPEGILGMVQRGEMTYAAFFAMLWQLIFNVS